MADSIKDAAVGYFKRGWIPVPLKNGSKQPDGSGWQNTSYASEAEVAARFESASGVGLLLGEPSKGLVDVDLDSPEARRVAADLLPYTNRVSGRASSPSSHYWYIVPDAAGRQSFTHQGPGDMLVELRGTGGQTVVPPTTHVSGEAIKWESEGDPGETTWADLLVAVRRVAAAAILVRGWGSGSRHNLALAVAGSCLRNGMSTQEVEHLVAVVADAAGDDEVADRIEAVKTTSERLEDEKAVQGLPTLASLLPPGDAEKVADLLGIKQEKAPAPQPAPDDDEFSFPLTDLGNAERFAAMHVGKVCFTKQLGWLVWTGRRWQVDETGLVYGLATETVRSIYDEAAKYDETDKKQKPIIAKLRAWANACESRRKIEDMLSLAQKQQSLAASLNDFDTDPWLFNVQNGVLDLKTGTLLPHEPSQRITKISPVTYDPEAKAPLWLSFLDKVMGGNAELIEFLQQAAGYTLTGDAGLQCFFVLYGGGANGKSTFIDSMRHVIGDYAARLDTEAVLAGKRSGGATADLARLVNIRFAVASEIGEGRRANEGLIKDLTGGSTISARHLYKDPFEFVPNLKLWIDTNSRPTVGDESEGFWRRVRLVPFTVTVPEGERDPQLLRKLKAEAPGILNWMLAGLKVWLEKDMVLTQPKEVSEATETYRQDMDAVQQWINERTEFIKGTSTSVSAAYRDYQQWAKDSGMFPFSVRRFSESVVSKGIKKTKTSTSNRFEDIQLIAPPDQFAPTDGGWK